MRDDDLLRALGAQARREQEADPAALDERWDRLAAGELSPAEEAELHALAGESAEGGAAYEAFRPLDAAFRRRVVRAVRAGQAGQAQALTRTGDVALAAAGQVAAPPRRRLLSFRRRPAWTVGGLAAAAAAVAAAVALLVGVQPALPVYELAVVNGGVASQRGGPALPGAGEGRAADLVLQPDSRLEITARPQTKVAGSVEGRWFAARPGGAARELAAAGQEVSASGVVTLAGTAGRDLRLDPGVWTLWLMVGRKGDLPGASILDAPDAASRGWTRRARGWIAWRVASLRVTAGESKER